MLRCPFFGIFSTSLIGNLPHFPHFLWVEMRRDRKFIACHSSPSFVHLQVIRTVFLMSEYREGWACVSTEKRRDIEWPRIIRLAGSYDRDCLHVLISTSANFDDSECLRNLIPFLSQYPTSKIRFDLVCICGNRSSNQMAKPSVSLISEAMGLV